MDPLVDQAIYDPAATGGLGQRFDRQHTWENWVTGKVTGEKWVILRYVFQRDHSDLVMVIAMYHIKHLKWIAVRHQVSNGTMIQLDDLIGIGGSGHGCMVSVGMDGNAVGVDRTEGQGSSNETDVGFHRAASAIDDDGLASDVSGIV